MNDIQKRIQSLEKQLEEANKELKRIENTMFAPRRKHPELTEKGIYFLNQQISKHDPTTLFGQKAIVEIIRDVLTPMGITIIETNFKTEPCWIYLYMQYKYHGEYFMERMEWNRRNYQ